VNHCAATPASSRVLFHSVLRCDGGATLCWNVTIGQLGELVTGVMSQRAAYPCFSKSLPAKCDCVLDVGLDQTYVSAYRLAAVLECDQSVRMRKHPRMRFGTISRRPMTEE